MKRNMGPRDGGRLKRVAGMGIFQRRGFSRRGVLRRILRRELLQGGLRGGIFLYRDIGRATGKKDT
jgi:hypothetical protein